tara:strand:+ start:97 stop:705 length:609 start_codon:yes stop_codon:yes gene_type:complete
MTSQIRVDSIVPTTGVPTGGGGGIVQVVQSTKTDTASVTGPTFGDVGLSATITPKSSSNKILVLVQANIGGSVGYDMKTRLMRGNTPIHIGDAAGGRARTTTTVSQSYTESVTNNKYQTYNADQANINYLDSPSFSVGDTLTYKIQMASYNINSSNYTVYINRNGADLDASNLQAYGFSAGTTGSGFDGRGASSIILMEVSG